MPILPHVVFLTLMLSNLHPIAEVPKPIHESQLLQWSWLFAIMPIRTLMYPSGLYVWTPRPSTLNPSLLQLSWSSPPSISDNHLSFPTAVFQNLCLR